MDVVIQFATHNLGFQLGDIIIYAWSIGGFTGKQRQSVSVMWSWVPEWFHFILNVLPSFPMMTFLLFFSHVGSDVIPRDQSRGAGCLL